MPFPLTSLPVFVCVIYKFSGPWWPGTRVCMRTYHLSGHTKSSPEVSRQCEKSDWRIHLLFSIIYRLLLYYSLIYYFQSLVFRIHLEATDLGHRRYLWVFPFKQAIAEDWFSIKKLVRW